MSERERGGNRGMPRRTTGRAGRWRGAATWPGRPVASPPPRTPRGWRWGFERCDLCGGRSHPGTAKLGQRPPWRPASVAPWDGATATTRRGEAAAGLRARCGRSARARRPHRPRRRGRRADAGRWASASPALRARPPPRTRFPSEPRPPPPAQPPATASPPCRSGGRTWRRHRHGDRDVRATGRHAGAWRGAPFGDGCGRRLASGHTRGAEVAAAIGRVWPALATAADAAGWRTAGGARPSWRCRSSKRRDGPGGGDALTAGSSARSMGGRDGRDGGVVPLAAVTGIRAAVGHGPRPPRGRERQRIRAGGRHRRRDPTASVHVCGVLGAGGWRRRARATPPRVGAACAATGVAAAGTRPGNDRRRHPVDDRRGALVGGGGRRQQAVRLATSPAAEGRRTAHDGVLTARNTRGAGAPWGGRDRRGTADQTRGGAPRRRGERETRNKTYEEERSSHAKSGVDGARPEVRARLPRPRGEPTKGGRAGQTTTPQGSAAGPQTAGPRLFAHPCPRARPPCPTARPPARPGAATTAAAAAAAAATAIVA